MLLPADRRAPRDRVRLYICVRGAQASEHAPGWRLRAGASKHAGTLRGSLFLQDTARLFEPVRQGLSLAGNQKPAQDWHACIIFASRKLEPAETHPYRALLASDQVTRIYLDELPQAGE